MGSEDFEDFASYIRDAARPALNDLSTQTLLHKCNVTGADGDQMLDYDGHLWGAVGGAATRDVPSSLGGEAMDVRLPLLESLSRELDEAEEQFAAASQQAAGGQGEDALTTVGAEADAVRTAQARIDHCRNAGNVNPSRTMRAFAGSWGIRTNGRHLTMRHSEL